jgi:TonB family protein
MIRVKMKTLMLSLSLICATMLFSVAGAAQATPTPQQLIDAAHKRADASQLVTYVFTANVVVNPGDKKNVKTGRLTISRDHNRARVELEIGDLHETRLFLGDKAYAAPGQGLLFTIGLDRFDQIWDPAQSQAFHFPSKYRFGDVRRERTHSVDAWCFDRIFEGRRDHLCFDPDRPKLLHEDSSGKTMEFFDFTRAGQPGDPRQVRIDQLRMPPIEVNNIAFTSAVLKDEVFTVPEKSIELETCDDMKPAQATYTPVPEFPEEARRKRKSSIVLLHILVTKEGMVSTAQAMNPDKDGFDENAKEKVKTWRFKPATCGDRPVNSEMLVEVAYNL